MAPRRPMTLEIVHIRPQPLNRRFFVVFCVVAHLVATTGFPVSQSMAIEAGSAPFPCRHHHCGCSSAAQCWRSCCCMSMQEKLVWAKEHGVIPPDFVVAAAKAEITTNKPRSCCQNSRRLGTPCALRHTCSTAANNSQSHEEDSGEPYRQRRAAGEVPTEFATGARAANGWDWVLAARARQCRGLATHWLASGAVLPPPSPLKVPVDTAPPLWWDDIVASLWQAGPKQPDVPPPRRF